MTPDTLVLRVAARFQQQVGLSGGTLVGTEWRLTLSRDEWKLEELPAKGKMKLRVSDMQNPGGRGWANFDAYIPENILHHAKITSSDSYEHVKEKMAGVMAQAADATITKATPDQAKHMDWLRELKWYEKQVHYLTVTPEGVEPFDVEGKDFTVKVSWTDFSAYSPSSDFQQADPSYSVYNASAPTGARKMYQILKANPDALKGIGWNKFDEWMKANKIGYKIHFSQWH
jgi:hypothetical protein